MSRRGRSRKSVQKAIRCLFCAEPCPPTFGGVQEQPVKKRKTATAANESPQKLTSLEEEEWCSLTTQLKNMFVLKNILEIGEEKLNNFLGRLEGQLTAEFWIHTCEPCAEAVQLGYSTCKEISKLQSKFNTIKVELVDRIVETREETTKGGGGKDDEHNSVWKEVREVVVEELENESTTAVADDDDDDDDDDVAAVEKHSISDNVVYEEKEEDIDAFLQGQPPSHAENSDESDLELPSKTSRFLRKPERKQQLSLSSATSFDDKRTTVARNSLKIPTDEDEDEGTEASGATGDNNSNISDEESEQEWEMEHLVDQEDSKTENDRTSSNPFALDNYKRGPIYPTTSAGVHLVSPPETTETPYSVEFEKGPTSTSYYKCGHCPMIVENEGETSEKEIDAHLMLHRPGSSAITCAILNCGCALDPTLVNQHNAEHHPRAKRNSLKMKSEDEEFNQQKQRRTRRYNYYRCSDCGALFSKHQRLKEHRLLHDKGEGTVCLACGWLCKNLAYHTPYWHPTDGGRIAKIRMRTAGRKIVTLGRNHKFGRGSSFKKLYDGVTSTSAEPLRIADSTETE